MDEKLLPVAKELATVPAIPTFSGANSTPAAGPKSATLMTTMTTDLQRKTAIMALEVSSGDNAPQEEIVELVVRGPLSKVLQIQGFVQELSRNDKTPHR